MDHRAALILAASLLCGSAHAFYAQATPPPGFVAGAINTFNGAKAGATASLELGRIAANAALNVGGKTVSIASKIPYAANAARVAAQLIYLHPAVRTTAKVAALLGLSGLAFDVADGLWKKVSSDSVVSTGVEYKANGYAEKWHPTAQLACDWAVQKYSAAFPGESVSGGTVSGTQCVFQANGREQKTGISSRQSMCPSGWYQTPAGCVQNPPMVAVPQDQFVDDLVKQPTLPNILPELPFDLPVDVPYIEPVFIPTGNPVKNPNYDPAKPQTAENQPWIQPGVKVDPANDAKNPFQVNVQPVNRPVDNPQGSKDPVPETSGSGDGDKPRDPEKDERDLCEKYPEILACQKMDEPEDPGELKTKAVDLDFQVQTGYAGSAVCPAPMTYEAFGHVLSLSWQPFCDSLAMVKNLLLAFAWISAAFILLGAKKE